MARQMISTAWSGTQVSSYPRLTWLNFRGVCDAHMLLRFAKLSMSSFFKSASPGSVSCPGDGCHLLNTV